MVGVCRQEDREAIDIAAVRNHLAGWYGLKGQRYGISGLR